MSKKDIEVLGIGNAIVDIIADVEESFLDSYKLTKGVMRLIDEAYADRLHKDIIEVKLSSGGSVANTIAGLSILGNKVGFIGKTGKDKYGDFFAEELKRLGVQYKREYILTDKPTARCIILTTPDAERTMNTCLGISSDLHPEDIDTSMVERSEMIYLEGYLWDQESAKNAFLKAIDLCKKNKGKVVMSLSDPFCVDRHRKEFLGLFENHLDIVFANEDEIKSLFMVEDFEEALDICRSQKSLCVLTRSENGSIIVNGREITKIEAAVPKKVIDTTGAGDLYAAGFLHGYIKGLDLSKCGSIASIVAGEIVSHFGARPEEDLKSLIKGLKG